MILYSFQNLFIEQLNELYSAEKQLVEFLPSVIGVISSLQLQEAVDQYLHESQHHIEQLKSCFNELRVNPTDEKCKPVQGMIEETVEVMQHGGNSPVKDAALIGMIQRLAHFKMAVYGTARTYARHLNYKAMDLLQRALNDEGEMDHKLTHIAEGGIFTTGINETARRSKLEV